MISTLKIVYSNYAEGTRIADARTPGECSQSGAR
jgi:hypothetical protein